MNPWLSDPRVVRAEQDSFEAERAERRARWSQARSLYRQAADSFAAVALSVCPDHPNTRSDLAIAAVACYVRSGDTGAAVDFARRVLAEAGVTAGGREELIRLVGEAAEV